MARLFPRLFARTTQDPAPTPTTSAPRGGSGRFNYNGYPQFEELNAELRHPFGHTIYDRMWRTDPDVHRSLSMCLNPILGATWSVEPYGGADATQADLDAAEFVQWALFEMMRPGLLGHLAEALPLVGRSGFAPFEESWKSETWKGKTVLVPRKLHARLPRSVHRWLEDDYEDLTAIEQFAPGRTPMWVQIPATELVYYRIGAEGNNWEGQSLLRPVYKPWFFKDGLERIDSIAQELEGTGLPVVYPPLSNDADMDQLEEQLQRVRTGETAYLVMPGPAAQDLTGDAAGQGWRLDLLGRGAGQGGGRDASNSLKYHSDKIAAALITEFMRLGMNGIGARATADVQQDPFLNSVEGFATTVIEDTLNHGGPGQPLGLVPRLAYLNFPNLDGPPQLSMSLVDSTSLAELADFTQKLVNSGALHPDDMLEDYLRDKADMPPADPAARDQRHQEEEQASAAADAAAKAAADGEDVPPPKNPNPGQPAPDATKPADAGTKTAARQQRDLKPHEMHMSLDEIEQAIDGARETFQAAGSDAARTAASDIAAAAAAGKSLNGKPSGELVDALHGALEQLYALGQRTVDQELASQGAEMPVHAHARTGMTSAKMLAKRAAAAAREVMSAIVREVTRAHLRGGDQAAMQQAGEAAAGAALRAEAMVHAAPALNLGRADQADVRADEIAGSRYTSVLDGNTCLPCSKADDDVLRPLTDPVRLSRRPPNPDCLGGDRCRCMEAYQLRTETPASG